MQKPNQIEMDGGVALAHRPNALPRPDKSSWLARWANDRKVAGSNPHWTVTIMILSPITINWFAGVSIM
jgi:hypothetical protein